MSLIAKRLQMINPSPTLAVTAKAKALAEKGIEIISLAAGEPDFDTPENIKEAAIEGINQGATKYTAVSGMMDLKKAICAKFERENNLKYALDEVMVSTGGKQVIYNLFMATINDNDEVIIPAPYWVSYPDIVLLAGGKPVIISGEIQNNFKVNAKIIEEAITKKTKWLILNSPSNPTGCAYNKKELEAIAEMLRKHPHVHVMCDDIYEHIVFDDFKFYTLAQIAPDLKDRIFTINGVSKAYSMTGWRIGYGAGNKELIKAMTTIQSQSTSNPSSVSQVAAIEALNGTQDYIKTNAENFKKKRDLTAAMINKINGLEVAPPQGAFYLFVKCSDLFEKNMPESGVINSSSEFATYLLDHANVAVVPGAAFGVEGYIRISYATSEELLEQACKKIASAVAKLK